MSRGARFWRWYRTMPILAMALVTALCLGFDRLPGTILRQVFFPISHQGAIVESSTRHDVDPLLVCAVIRCESNWNESAVSGAGAVGLMQLMPSTSAELAQYGLVDGSTYDPANLTNAETNIEYGCAYLQQLDSQLGSTDEVIAAYNAGPGSVESWLSGGGDIADVIDFPETAFYLTRVKESYERYKSLYTDTLAER